MDNFRGHTVIPVKSGEYFLATKKLKSIKRLKKEQKKREKYAVINAKRKLTRNKRIEVLEAGNLESLEYRQAFWGKYGKIFVSPEDQKDIKAGEAIMRKTARTTIDQSKVPWYVGSLPQHRPFYHMYNGKVTLVTNQYPV